MKSYIGLYLFYRAIVATNSRVSVPRGPKCHSLHHNVSPHTSHNWETGLLMLVGRLQQQDLLNICVVGKSAGEDRAAPGAHVQPTVNNVTRRRRDWNYVDELATVWRAGVMQLSPSETSWHGRRLKCSVKYCDLTRFMTPVSILRLTSKKHMQNIRTNTHLRWISIPLR